MAWAWTRRSSPGPAILRERARGDAWIDLAGASSPTPRARPTGHAGVEVPVGPFVLAAHLVFVTWPPSFVERHGNRGAFLNAPISAPSAPFTT